MFPDDPKLYDFSLENFKPLERLVDFYWEKHRYYHAESKKIVVVTLHEMQDLLKYEKNARPTFLLLQEHPNISAHYGWCRDCCLTKYVCTEDMDFCLYKLVLKIREHENISYISEEILGYIAVTTVDALSFMHSKGIAHQSLLTIWFCSITMGI